MLRLGEGDRKDAAIFGCQPGEVFRRSDQRRAVARGLTHQAGAHFDVFTDIGSGAVLDTGGFEDLAHAFLLNAAARQVNRQFQTQPKARRGAKPQPRLLKTYPAGFAPCLGSMDCSPSTMIISLA